MKMGAILSGISGGLLTMTILQLDDPRKICIGFVAMILLVISSAPELNN